MERFARFRFSVLTVPLGKGFSAHFQYSYKGDGTVPVPENGSDGSGSVFGSWKNPVLPFLVFWEFLVFFPSEEFLVFFTVFPFFSRDFRGSVGLRNPCLFWWFSLPCFLKKNKERKDRERF